MKSKILLLLFGLSFFGFAQENDSLLVPIDSVAFDVPVVDSIDVIFSGNDVQNVSAVSAFYEKLYQLHSSLTSFYNVPSK